MPNQQSRRVCRAAVALLLCVLLSGAPSIFAAEDSTPPTETPTVTAEVPGTAAPEPTGPLPSPTASDSAENPPDPLPPESGAEPDPPPEETGVPTPEATDFGEVSLSAAEMDPDHPLVTGDSLPVDVNLAVDADYPWGYNAGKSSDGYDAYVAGNSGTKTANVSNLAITVSQAGVLGFDWKVSTGSSGNYRLCYRVNEPVTAANAASGTYIQGTKPWTHVSVTITEDMLTSGRATVYIAYVRGGSATSGSNYGAVANVCLNEGLKDVALAVEGGDYGGVTGLNSGTNRVKMGDTITLTAAPAEGNRFYGWVVDGQFQGNEAAYTQTVLENTSIQAVFAPKDRYAARRNGTFYPAGTALETILAEAGNRDVVELLSDLTLTADAAVPPGATLLVPYGDGYDPDGSVNSGEDPAIKHTPQLAGDSYVYRTLTVEMGVTLTVNGILRVGSVIGYPQMNAYSGHTSGAHGKVICDGAVTVAPGGVLDCWGDIAGGGRVTVSRSATAMEPFIVLDFAGGSNTSELYLGTPSQSPFKQYAMQNIGCELVVQPGGGLYGHCNLYASGGFNKTDAPIIAPDGLFAPAANATVTRTIDLDRQVKGAPGIGRATYRVTGGMTFQSLTLKIMGITISTAGVDFPVPFSYGFELENGTYQVPQKLKLMPGAELTVGKGATLEVTGSLYALDGLKQGAMSGKSYPSGAALKAAGYPQNAVLTIDGTLNVAADAALGGVVQTTGTSGALSIAEGAELSNSKVQDGGKGFYCDNTATFDLPARGYLNGALTQLSPGAYRAGGAAAYTLDSVTVTYCANGVDIDKAQSDYRLNGPKYTTETLALAQPMTGAWREGSAPPPELPGDLDGNGKVDVTDLNLLLANYQGAGAGDIDGNGKVDVTDLNLLLANYQKTLGG